VASAQNKQELRDKVAALVAARFAGDYRATFGHYDTDRDGAISTDELKALLADAGVGSRLTRWLRAAGIMKELDADTDGLISWPEFAAGFERQKGVAPPGAG